MFDRGTANTSQMFSHLLHQLGVKVEIPKAHNARAKGQVEKAMTLWSDNLRAVYAL
ncbi:Uncharacterised protein [Actinobacillus equuli]|nr:Uncharacterised protein [Actinobacillus equuli]